MKHLFLTLTIMLFALLVNVHVVSADTEYRLNETFNSISSGIPSGWDNSEGTTSTADYRWTATSGGHTGNCLRFNSYNNFTGNDNYLRTPSMDLSTRSWLLKFWYMNPTNTGEFKIYISTDGGATRTLLQEGFAHATNWTFQEISLTDAAAASSTVLLYFYAVSDYGGSSNYIYLDDVSVESAPDCRAPDGLNISNLTTTSATVNWGFAGGISTPASYSYVLKDAAGTTIASNPALVAPSNSYNITGLTANTTYTVELTGDCNASSHGLSNTASITFTTLCTPQAAPYSNDFNAETTIPECTYTSSAALVPSLGRTGSAIQLSTTASVGAYIVFPELTLASNNVEATFWLKTSSVTNGSDAASTPVWVGIVTDPSDPGGSFEQLHTDSLSTTNWTEIRMNTALTTQPVTQTTMIGIFFPQGFTRYTLLDDVTIHAIPSCIRPENFTLGNVTSNSVDLEWTTTNATSARIDVISATDTTFRIATTNPYTVTGLNPDTEYSFRICGICAPGDTSEYSNTTLIAKTACVVATSAIFNESFDNLGTNLVPNCWDQGWLYRPLSNNKPVPFSVSGANAHSGAYSMSLVDQQDGSLSYLSTQCLPIDQAGKYTLSVWVYRQDAASYPEEGLKFWVTPNFDDTVGGTLLGYIPRNYASAPYASSSNEWYNYEFIINTTGNQYILVEGISQYGSATLFDDLQVKLTPSCMKVTDITLGVPTNNSVDVNWTAGKNETQWIVNYNVNLNGTIVRSEVDTVNSPTVTIDQLVQASTYTVAGSVTSYCGGNDVADSVRFNFTFVTTCEALTTLPYTCGFEATEISKVNNPLPLCWSRYNDAPNANHYPYAYSTTNARNGNYCLVYYPITSLYMDYGDNQVAVLPEINTAANPMNTLRMVFYGKLSGTATGSLLVIAGVMSDPTDLSTFVPVDSFGLVGTSYVKCDASFANYTGNGTYMAIRVPRSTESVNLYIDDVKIDTIPYCADLDDKDFAVSDITANTAKFTVIDQTATDWSYALGIAGTPVTGCTVVDTAGANVVVTGLEHQTDYVVYVRRNCGNAYGYWSDPIYFKTACAASDVPYFDDFESYTVDSLKGCYEVSNAYYFLKVHSSSATASGNSQVNHTAGGSKGVCSSSEYTTPYDVYDNDYRTLAYLHLEAGQNYEISLYAKAGTGYAGIYDWNMTFQVGNSINTLNNVGTAHIDDTEWDRYGAYFTVSATGDYYVGFTTSLGNEGYYYIFFDDFSVDAVNCIPPTSTSISNLTDSTATVNVTSTSTSWLAVVSTSPIDISGTVTGDIYYDTINTPALPLTGLYPNTEYYYTFRSICSQGGMSAWMTPSSFRTLCSAFELPYVESYEAMGSTLCWTPLASLGSIARSPISNSGTGAMLVSGGAAVSPELNVTSLAPYTVTGWVYSPVDSAVFTVGVCYDPSEASSYQDFNTVTVSPANTWVEFTCNLNLLYDPDYSEFANSRFVAFGVAADKTFYFDDVMVDITPTCPKPAEGTISAITAHSANIGWTESGTATSWHVEVVSPAAPAVTMDVTTPSASVTGLNAATSYTVYVQSVCSATDSSYKYKIGSFTTECDYIIAPFFESFESYSFGQTPKCWDISASTTSTKTANPDYVWGVHTANNNNAIRMNNYNVQSGTALINTPEIILENGKSYQLRYDYSNRANAGDLIVKMKRHSDPDFTQVANHMPAVSTDQDDPGTFTTNVIDLDLYAGDTILIQFFSNANWGYGAIWVDNVKVRELSSCVEPVTVTVSNIGVSSATVTFTDTVAAHTSWQYAYGVTGFNVYSATPIPVTAKTFNLSGLTGSTSYDVYVRAICGANDFSAWTQASFRTTAVPATLPYITDFSDGSQNADWEALGSGANTFMFGTDADARFGSGTHALYVSNGSQYGYNYTSASKTGIARLFYFDEASYNIEFDWKCTGGEIYYDFARFYLVPANVSPLSSGTGSSSYHTWPAGLIPLDGGSTVCMTSGDQHVSQVIDFTGKAGSYKLVFCWVNDGGGGSNYPLSVGNLSVSEVTCQLITNPKIVPGSVTLNSVDVTCTNPNPGTNVRWVVSNSNVVRDSVLSGIATTDTFTISGLSASAHYYLFLRAECSSTDASPWVNIAFNTACGVVTAYPFVQDFEDATFPPACWGNVTTAIGTDYMGQSVPGQWGRDVFSYTPYGNGQAWAHLYGFTGSAAILSTPCLYFENDREYHVSFSMYHYGSNYYTDQVDVYVGPNPDKTGAVKLATLMAYDDNLASYTDAVTTHDFDIPASMTGNCYVFFEGSYKASGMIYIDDITVDRYPLCRNLTEDPSLVATTASSVTVSEPLGNHSAIIFGIAPYTTTVSPYAITDTIVSTTGVATFTGLNAATNYAVYARGVCGEIEDTTIWSGFVKCLTKVDDCFAPDGLHAVGNITDTSAVIAWNPVPDASVYVCEIAGLNIPATSFTTTSTQAAFDTLASNSLFNFKVRAVCGAGDTTAYSSVYQFRTLNTPAYIPYFTGFETSDDNALWTRVTSAWANNFIFGSNSGGVCTGNQGLYISNNGSSYAQTVPTVSGYYYDDKYNVAYAYHTVYFPAAGNYDISFDWKCDPEVTSSSYYHAFGRAMLAPVDALLTADDPQYQRKNPAGAIALGSDLTGRKSWTPSNSIVAIDGPCYRNVLFMWFAMNQYGYAELRDASNFPLAIDNLSVTVVDCLPVTGISSFGVSDTYGSLVVDKAEAVDVQYAVLTVNSKDSISTFTTVPSTALKDTIALTGLTPSTQYYVFVRTVCDDTHLGNWRMLALRTTGVPATLPYACDFENTQENSQWTYELSENNHFFIGTATSNGGNKSIYVTSDNVANTYDNSVQSDIYAARIFYLPAGLYEYSLDWKAVGESTYDYARIFLLPAETTFSNGIALPALTPATLPQGAIALDGNTYLNQKSNYQNITDTFRINEDHSYNLMLYWHNDFSGGSNPPLAVDNIVLQAVTCLPPSASIIASETTETSVKAVLQNNEPNSSLVYCASLTGRFEDAVAIDTIPYNAGYDTVVLSGLSASSTYQLMARSICGVGDESLWSRRSFKTLCGEVSTFPYTESFETLGGSYRSGLIEDICWSALNDESGFPNYNATNSNSSEGNQSLMLHSSSSKSLYMILPEMTDINGLNLSFSMKSESTYSSTGIIYAGYMSDPTDASTFVTLLTTVRSTNWVDYSTVITNAPAGARIAFKYGNAGSNNYYSWIDDVRVTELVMAPAYYDTICHNKPYNLHGFSQAASTMHDGDNVFTRVRKAVLEGEKDTLYTANVYMRPEITSSTYDTICAGDPYIKGGWNIANPTSYRYTKTQQGAAACGCDSTEVLYLTVIPASFVINDTICSGDSYLFGDTVITTPGMYTREYISLLGCNTHDTLYLMVLPDTIYETAEVCQNNLPYVWRGTSVTTAGRHTKAITGEHGCAQTAILDLTVYKTDSTCYVTFCQGGSVQVADTVIKDGGNYTLIRSNTFGCNITYHITAAEVMPNPTHVYDYACEGHLYSGYGITNLYVEADTVVVITTTTVDAQCDSVSNVHLTFVATVYTDESAAIVEGDVFRWNGRDITEEGIYTEVLQSKAGCDSIVTLTLTFKGAGVVNVADVNMTIVPNPVNAGATALVYGDFGEIEKVEILNNFGQLVDQFIPESYPIEVSGISASGLYYVRVTTKSGSVHLQKLMVK